MPGIFPNAKVDKALLEDVLNFVRRDGPLSAPICFLTIEDGGGLTEELASKERFIKHVRQDGVLNVPPGFLKAEIGRTSVTARLGHLGIRVAKVMSGLCGVKKYDDYIREYLYQHNEMNVKFYPISFSTFDGGSDAQRKPVETYLGLTINEYREVCRLARPERLLMRAELFQASRFYVASCPEWVSLMLHVFKDISLADTYTHTENGRDAFRIFFDKKGIARFAYLGLLDRSTSDKRISDFVAVVNEYADKSILARLQPRNS